MFIRKVVFCTAIALGSIAIPATAQISINLGVAPPPVRYEVIPEARVGYAWAPGYWNYENEKHVWAPGRWQEERRGSNWVPDRWVARDGRYYLENGRWEEKK